MKKTNKNKLPVLDSDQDFLSAFEKKEETGQTPEKKDQTDRVPDRAGDPEIEEDFEQLLAQSFEKNRAAPLKKTTPVPLKKRLKRYPPAERVLDLHGYTAIGAQVRTRSFIHTSKLEGFFTVKIIVGKGRHSDFGPVLPDVVEDEVKEMKKQNLVLWFEWEKKTKSASGALIVYLKQFERFE